MDATAVPEPTDHPIVVWQRYFGDDRALFAVLALVAPTGTIVTTPGRSTSSLD